MRLFIGIKTGCENRLMQLQQELRKAGSGNFTDAHNLHITLKFLGEVPSSKIQCICEAIIEAGGTAFELECGGIQVLNKSGIVSAKVGGETGKLENLYAKLETALEKRGFAKETRAYRAHITLARRFTAPISFDFNAIPHVCCRFPVNEIILFESRRENGKLIYAPLFTRKLERPVK